MAHRLRERLERSLGALVLVRHGQAACAALSSVVGAAPADGQLTPALRKRVSRHPDDCAPCTDERDRRLRREALLRPEERRRGHAVVSPCRSRWSTYHDKKNKT